MLSSNSLKAKPITPVPKSYIFDYLDTESIPEWNEFLPIDEILKLDSDRSYNS